MGTLKTRSDWPYAGSFWTILMNNNYISRARPERMRTDSCGHTKPGNE